MRAGRDRGPARGRADRSRLALQLEDYAALPITADNTDQNTRAQLARVNYLRDEPGGRRFFVNDLNGPLYLLDKQTKAFTKYLDFNGAGGRPGPVPEVHLRAELRHRADQRHPRSGLREQRRVLHAAHGGPVDTGIRGAAERRRAGARSVRLHDHRRRVPTPTVDGRIDREVVLVEWKDRNIANATFEGTARELLRVQYPLAPHPLGEMTFNPAARPGDPDWRVMYLGAGDSQSGEQRDSRRLNPQRLDTLVGKILRIIPDLRRAHEHQHRQRERALPHPERQSVRRGRRRAQGDLGLRAAQSASAGLGRRPGAAQRADAAGVHHRPRHLGGRPGHSQGGQLRLSAA